MSALKITNHSFKNYLIGCIAIVGFLLVSIQIYSLYFKNDKNINYTYNSGLAGDNSSNTLDISNRDSSQNNSKMQQVLSVEDMPGNNYKNADLDDAKKKMGGKLLLPSYIPSEFMLKNIKVNASNENNIILQYMSPKQEFVLKQSKNFIEPIDDNKTIMINDCTGYISYLKKEPSDVTQESNVKLQWKYNDIYYVIYGNINDVEAIKIAKSIK